jgi:hypothetical protein
MNVWLVWGKWPCEEDIDQPTILFVASSQEIAEAWCEEKSIRTYWLDERTVDKG